MVRWGGRRSEAGGCMQGFEGRGRAGVASRTPEAPTPEVASPTPEAQPTQGLLGACVRVAWHAAQCVEQGMASWVWQAGCGQKVWQAGGGKVCSTADMLYSREALHYSRHAVQQGSSAAGMHRRAGAHQDIFVMHRHTITAEIHSRRVQTRSSPNQPNARTHRDHHTTTNAKHLGP